MSRDPQSVRAMFGRITPRYDFLNHLLSLNVDRWWRRVVARRFAHVLARPGARVLDLCCGTGDLMLALGPAAHGKARILGADFCHPMLERAREKLEHAQRPPLVVEADGLGLPFPDGTFDLVTVAFGLRNLADYETGLREMRRILVAGGELGILEFSEASGPLRPAYDFYFRRILPRVGAAVSGDAAAYSYLTKTVSEFPSPDSLAELIASAGFADISYRRLTGGIACLHTAHA